MSWDSLNVCYPFDIHYLEDTFCKEISLQRNRISFSLSLLQGVPGADCLPGSNAAEPSSIYLQDLRLVGY